MPLIIEDDVLEQAGLSERDARVEFACRMFDAQKLSLPQAAKLANLNRVQFENELYLRGIPAYRITREILEQDLESLKKLGL